jgi:hypothetical protein
MPKLKEIELSPEEEALADSILIRLWEKKQGTYSWAMNHPAIPRLQYLRSKKWVRRDLLKQTEDDHDNSEERVGRTQREPDKLAVEITTLGCDQASIIFQQVVGMSRYSMSTEEVRNLLLRDDIPYHFRRALDMPDTERRIQASAPAKSKAIAPPQFKIHKLRD